MSIRFECTQCGKRLKAADDYAGRKVRCSGCGASLLVPAPVAELAAQTPDASEPPPLEEEVIASALPPSKPMSDADLVDMTAMVDIVFFLLIFFMVTSMAKLQASLKIPPPDTSEVEEAGDVVYAPPEEDEFVNVRIDRDDTVWVEEVEAPTPQEIIAQLRNAKDSTGSDRVQVEANGDARHETVVTVLDAANEAEMAGVTLISIEEE